MHRRWILCPSLVLCIPINCIAMETEIELGYTVVIVVHIVSTNTHTDETASDKPSLLRNSILSNSLTSGQHARSKPSLNLLFSIGLSIPFFTSIPALFFICHFLSMLQCFSIYFSLIYSMCQTKCHGCRHTDINPVRIFFIYPKCGVYLLVIVAATGHV